MLRRKDRRSEILRAAQVRHQVVDRSHVLSTRPTRARHVERQLLLRQAGERRKVTLEGLHVHVERKVTLSLQGQTDANGNFEFEFDLPSHLTGSDLDQGLARSTCKPR